MVTTDLSIQSAEYSLRDPAAQPLGRLLCLDIYRGLMVAGMIIVDNPGSDEHAYWPIMHAKWNGWTPADFIFPSFLFLVGISLVYSTAARKQRGQSNGQILWHGIKRSLILIRKNASALRRCKPVALCPRDRNRHPAQQGANF